MVATTRYWDKLSIMTPGTNSMLRARRKDKELRPNRLLDRTASRGMIYENEELRLRTINMNADLEKGQLYIKKLRRENNQLRREIWNLRDQYDKLECMIRNQEQEQELISINEESDRYNHGEFRHEPDEPDTLSIVAEESENEDSKTMVAAAAAAAAAAANHGTVRLENNSDNSTLPDVTTNTHEDVGLGAVVQMVTIADLMNNDVTHSNIYFENGTPAPDDKNKMFLLRTCEDFINVFQKNAEQQRSLVFKTDDAFKNLLVRGVIDSLEAEFKDDCHNIITGVRLTRRHCFVSVRDRVGYERLLHSSLQVCDKTIQLEDVWENSTILQLSAVPHYVIDEQIVATVARFADLIGNVERQSYKGFDTGERYVHIKTPDIVIPCQLLLGAICIPVIIIFPKPKQTNIARRKSFRSQININLKTPELTASEGSPKLIDSSQTPSQESILKQEQLAFFAKSTGIIPTPQVDTNVFQFPTTASATLHNDSNKKQPNSGNSLHPNTATISTKEQKSIVSSTDSPSAFRRFAQRSVNSFRKHQNCDTSQSAPSPAVFPGTPKIGRRPSLNIGVRPRGAEGYYNEYGSAYMRERSASDASSGRFSICRRKLSVTGHEESTKIPWCGCWGIGCC